jgi:hypothetical protein
VGAGRVTCIDSRNKSKAWHVFSDISDTALGVLASVEQAVGKDH